MAYMVVEKRSEFICPALIRCSLLGPAVMKHRVREKAQRPDGNAKICSLRDQVVELLGAGEATFLKPLRHVLVCSIPHLRSF